MRHRLSNRKLNRTSSHRQALLRNLSNALLRHETIKTTLPKAKELRRVVEPMITLGKTPTLANKRLAFNRLRDRDSVVKLFADLGLPTLDPANDRVMICGSPQMLKDLKRMLEERQFKEGNTSTPGDFVSFLRHDSRGREATGGPIPHALAIGISQAIAMLLIFAGIWLARPRPASRS